MAVLVTHPAMEISGVAAMFSEKAAVRVTTPEVIILSESLLVSVNVASEFPELTGGPTLAEIQLPAIANRGRNEELFFIGLLFPQIFCRF